VATLAPFEFRELPNLARAQYPLCIHVTNIEFSFVIFVIFLTIGPDPRGDCIAFREVPVRRFTRQARARSASGTDEVR
jgi:hypothetical protein